MFGLFNSVVCGFSRFCGLVLFLDLQLVYIFPECIEIYSNIL